MKKLIVILMLALAACGGQTMGGGDHDPFAQCLTDEGVKMYGAYWCPHCAEQKTRFGESFDFITYIECSLPNRAGETRACQLANIQSYPTWEFGDGSRATGVQSLEDLASRTSCEL